MHELKAGERLGRYLLLERLGAGGMGEVWLAVLEGSGTFRRRVVVKCIPPERAGDDRLATMLADEARILGLLHHPGIVAPVDYVEGEGGPILVLEHVDGTSLRTAIKLARRNRALMPEALAAHVGAEVARALHAAHLATDEQGRPLELIHRDVSPDNVLLSRAGLVRLADFGVARAIGNSDVTVPGAAPKGKRGYMAPEQAAGRPLGPSADVFSLGRVVAEAADVNCGPALRAVLDRATAERAKDRFQTANAFAEALADACPPPADPAGALAGWLFMAAPEALQPRETEPGGIPTPAGSEPARTGAPRRPFSVSLANVTPRSDPPRSETPRSAIARSETPRSEPPRTEPPRTEPPRTEPRSELFAEVASGPSWTVRAVAAVGALLVLGLPAFWYAEAHGLHFPRAAQFPGLHAPQGSLVVRSAPVGAEVYVDGTLRGVTPLLLLLAEGKHAVRVGSPRLEHWRAAEVLVREGARQQLQVDLTE